MAPKRLNFSDSEAAQLDFDIRTMLKYTEHSGIESSIYRFSGGPQKSTHAFGLLQADVGRNPAARDFLRTIKFTEDEIRELSRQGRLSNPESLNAKLWNHKQDVDHFVDDQIQGYIDHLDRLITYLDRRNPAAAAAIRNDHQLQLALLDYHNQLSINGLGEAEPPPKSLLSYLIGRPADLSGGTLQLDPKATLSRNDIQNYINHSLTAVNKPKETERRAKDLDKALGIITPSQNHLPRSVPPAPNRHPAGGGTRQQWTGSNKNGGDKTGVGARQAPAGKNPYTPPAGKNPPGPYETPPTSGPLGAFSYLDLARRPNALGPIPPMWDPGALPTGKNWLAGDSPLNLPAASANLPFQYSPNGVRGANPPGQPALAPTDYPTRPLPSDSPFFPRRNAFLEPAQPMTPWAQPQSVGKGSPAPPPVNLLGPWPGSYLEGSPDLPGTGSLNLLGPWPGSYPPGRKTLFYPDLERLLGRPF